MNCRTLFGRREFASRLKEHLGETPALQGGAAPASSPVPSDLAGKIDAKQTLIAYCLLQRSGVSPDRVIAFALEEKRLRTELQKLREQAATYTKTDNPEAAAEAGRK